MTKNLMNDNHDNEEIKKIYSELDEINKKINNIDIKMNEVNLKFNNVEQWKNLDLKPEENNKNLFYLDTKNFNFGDIIRIGIYFAKSDFDKEQGLINIVEFRLSTRVSTEAEYTWNWTGGYKDDIWFLRSYYDIINNKFVLLLQGLKNGTEFQCYFIPIDKNGNYIKKLIIN